MIHLLSPIDEGSIGSYWLLVNWLIIQEETGKLSGSKGNLKIG
jgi:hypothetical protein